MNRKPPNKLEDFFLEHVKHLRFVHFSLVLACIGLLIVGLTGRRDRIDQAISELAIADGFVEEWSQELKSIKGRIPIEGLGESSVPTTIEHFDMHDLEQMVSNTIAQPEAAISFPAKRYVKGRLTAQALKECSQQSNTVKCPIEFVRTIMFDERWKSVEWPKFIKYYIANADSLGKWPHLADWLTEKDIALGEASGVVMDYGVYPGIIFNANTVDGFAKVWNAIGKIGLEEDLPGTNKFGSLAEILIKEVVVSSVPSTRKVELESIEFLGTGAPSAGEFEQVSLAVEDATQTLDKLNKNEIVISGWSNFQPQLSKDEVVVEILTNDSDLPHIPRIEFMFPVRLSFHEFQPYRSVLAALLRNRPELTFATSMNFSGVFEKDFDALADATKGVRSIRIDQLGGLLENQRKANVRTISVFGIQAPEDLAREWGIAAIALALAYFLSHFRAFKRSAQAASAEGPWIGLYRDMMARALFISSSTVLPCAVGLWLTFVRGEPTAVGSISVCTLAVFAIWVAIEIVGFWRQQRDARTVPKLRPAST